ncbi:hypothetical protein GOODEAATRI_023147, partial [Goodea atripinnis]
GLQEVLNSCFPSDDVVPQSLLSSLGIGWLSIPLMLQVLCYTGTICLELLKGLFL